MAALPPPLLLRRELYTYAAQTVNYWVNRYNTYKANNEPTKANEIRTHAIDEFGEDDWNYALNNPPQAQGGKQKRRKSRRKTNKRKSRRRRKSSKRRRKPKRKTRRRRR